ncbi:MAG: sulfatase [Steroidobacteraceae bacterium]
MPNVLRAWRIAALPCLAVLGIALPLTFASHCESYLYDFRAIDLLPLYATAWLILAAVVIPFWILATAALLGLEAVRRSPGPLIAAAIRTVLLALTAAIIVATLIHCLRTWLGTFGGGLPLSADAGLALIILIGALAAVTAKGRAVLRAVGPIAVACTLAGVLSLASLPFHGWPHGGTELASQSAGADATASPQAGTGQAIPVETSATGPATRAGQPNIVILSIDALSAQHMSLYGYSRPTTPKLAEFASGAVTFDRAYSNSNFTTPGIASILTGTLPWTHRALQLAVWPRAATRAVSLPAVLRRAGYTMGYVSTNAYAGASMQGFGQYFQFARTDRLGHVTLCADGLSAYLRYVCAASELAPLEEIQGLVARLRPPVDNDEHDPRLATDPALHWLANVDRRRPVFLWVHLFPPHSPYAAPAPWLGEFDDSPEARDVAQTEPSWGWMQTQLSSEQVYTLAARYDEAMVFSDYYSGQFLQRALQLLGPNTAVIVTADHGESFSHSYGAHTGPGLYNEITRIPLILKLPGETTGRRCDDVVQQADIAPTLAALAGVAAPASWAGRSLVDACAPGQTDPVAGRPIFTMNFEQNPRFAALRTGSVAVIDGRWKLIHYMGRLHYPLMPPLHDELYDVVSDPDEHHNVAAQQPAVAHQLLGLINTELAQHGGRVVRGSQTAPMPMPPEQSAATRKPSDMPSGGVAAGAP